MTNLKLRQLIDNEDKRGISMYCKNCGKEIDDKAEICIGCGVRVKEVQEKKSPAIAALLSFVITGAGQIYNGQVGKGIAYFVLEIIFLILILAIIGIILAPLFWIYAIYEAYNTAKKINMSG